MAKTIARRDILKMSAAATLCAAAGVLAKSSTAEAGDTKSLLRAGIITDMHYLQFGSFPDFVTMMQASKFFPHTDLEAYPTVRAELKRRGLLL